MKFSEKARALKYRLSRYCCFDSRDRRCAERMRSFLLLFKLCGIFANDINKGALKRCSRPVYGICVFWISVYVSYVFFLAYSYVTSNPITMRLTVDVLKHMIGYINLIVNVTAAYTSQNHFGKFFDRLDSYDYEVAGMNKKRKDNLWIPWISTFLMTIIILFLLVVIVGEPSTGTLFFVILSDICTMSMNLYNTLEKFLLVYLILERFKHINDKIAPSITWDEKQHGPRTITVANLRLLHSILCDALQAFNEIYKNALLACFVSLMIHILANVRIFREKPPLIACAFIVPPVVQLLILCAICHYTAEEANKIPCVLSEYMTSLANTGKTMVKIDILTYFLHNHVFFEAAGFFTINLPLFHSIVATTTTYFILLI